MRILLTGASGFMGSHIATALRAQQHEVIPVSRQAGHDFANLQQAVAWHTLLADIDVVINSVGIIQQTRTQSFAALHTYAPIALFQACQDLKIKRVIQISALGTDDKAWSEYHLSKKVADDYLRKLPLDWFILRPSVVYGAGGKSAQLFQTLANLPVIPVFDDGKQLLQPVHISDLVATVLQCLRAKPAQRTLDVVGPQALTWTDWLQTMRRKQGKSSATTVSIPMEYALTFARLGQYFSPLFHPDNLRLLQQGNHANVAELAKFLGRMPLSVEQAA